MLIYGSFDVVKVSELIYLMIYWSSVLKENVTFHWRKWNVTVPTFSNLKIFQKISDNVHKSFRNVKFDLDRLTRNKKWHRYQQRLIITCWKCAFFGVTIFWSKNANFQCFFKNIFLFSCLLSTSVVNVSFFVSASFSLLPFGLWCRALYSQASLFVESLCFRPWQNPHAVLSPAVVASTVSV